MILALNQGMNVAMEARTRFSWTTCLAMLGRGQNWSRQRCPMAQEAVAASVSCDKK